WGGWAALALLCATTLMRANLARLFARAAWRKKRVTTTVAALLCSAITFSWAPSSSAQAAREAEQTSQSSDDADLRAPERPLGQLSNKFPVNLNDPKSNIPTIAERNKDPIQFGYWLMDLTVLADNALRKE